MLRVASASTRLGWKCALGIPEATELRTSVDNMAEPGETQEGHPGAEPLQEGDWNGDHARDGI